MAQASLGFGKKRGTPPAGITDRAVAVLRRFVDLSPRPDGCRACSESPCAVHVLRRDAQEVIADFERPES